METKELTRAERSAAYVERIRELTAPLDVVLVEAVDDGTVAVEDALDVASFAHYTQNCVGGRPSDTMRGAVRTYASYGLEYINKRHEGR